MVADTTVLLCTEIDVEQLACDDVTTDGSVSQQEAREVLRDGMAIHAWVSTVLNESRGRRVMCFLANECDARAASELLNREECPSAWVAQSLDPALRKSVWAKFRDGTLQCLIVVPDSLGTVWWARSYDDLGIGSGQHGE